MNAGGASRGVPDYGSYVGRERLNRLLDRAGDRMRLLRAPAGWGKTLAAADYARSRGHKAIWLDSAGEIAPPASVARRLLSLLPEERLGGCTLVSDDAVVDDLIDICRRLAAGRVSGPRTLIVLDDVDLRSEADIAGLADLSGRLRLYGFTIMVTSRSETEPCPRSHSDVFEIGSSQLALRPDEVTAIGHMLGASDESDWEEICRASGGHPALTELMIKEGAGGSRSEWSDDAQSEAYWWLGRLGSTGLRKMDPKHQLSHAHKKRGEVDDLRSMGIPAAEAFLLKVARLIPLVRVSARDTRGRRRFWVHDLAEEWLLLDEPQIGSAGTDDLARAVCRRLSARGEHRRAAAVMRAYAGEETRTEWLREFGQGALRSQAFDQVLELLDSVSVHLLMDYPPLLALWAESLLAAGLPSDALGKARAAHDLAEHTGDVGTEMRSMSAWIEALKRLDRHEESAVVADALIELAKSARDEHLTIESLVSLAMTGCNTGHIDRAYDAITEAMQLAERQDNEHELAQVRIFASMIRCLKTGDYASTLGAISAVQPQLDSLLSDRAYGRGSLAVVLVELGRLERVLPLASYAAESGEEYQQCSFKALPGIVSFSLGDTAEGIRLVEEANAHCIAHDRECDLAVNRINLAIMWRACAQLDKALATAERAFERLSIVDYLGYRRLAALEVAASLLSLGDVAAARRWVATVSDEALAVNRYHALRAALVLAECDLREGQPQAGVTRLAEHRDHIMSESSNWQIAMYVRAFPGLLGMLAVAVGPGALPVHMLRMVMPEHAERSLVACRSWMPQTHWHELGRRLLAEDAFARLEHGAGEPLCHVRLFGGLEVGLAGRTVATRDWRKRKARLLFAMLAVRLGQELPREQVLEYLWPEMSEERARNNFYVVWSAMKAALMGPSAISGPCPYLDNTGGRCRIVQSAVRSDVDEFERMVAEARHAESCADDTAALAAYDRIAQLYRGDLLPGDIYDDWFAGLRDRYRFDFVDAMQRAAEILQERDEPCEALVYLRRALRTDPLREDLYQAALRCHIAAGQRSAAIDTFIQCRSRLADDLGLDPAAETMGLYREVLVMEDRPRREEFGVL